MRTIHIRITGKVQGVYYRQSTADQATKLGLTGYVRNLPDGSVEIVAKGSSEQLDQLIEWCNTGPKDAIVESVEKTEHSSYEGNEFSIRK